MYMNRVRSGAIALPLLGVWLLAPAALADAPDDPYRWLEDIDSGQALAWVKEQNAVSTQRLTSQPTYAGLYRDALAVLESSARLPDIAPRGGWLYNLWRDPNHPRGLFRRATPTEFRRDQPAWQTVLDIDALAKAEGKPWAFGGTTWLPPDNRRCMVQLAPAGGDAAEQREFDVDKLAFVPGGFVLPTAKSNAAWRDADTLFVASDFGAGSLTDSGYPRVVKLWHRGTPLTTAETLYEAPKNSIRASARRLRTATGDIDLVTESLTFWTARHFQFIDGHLEALALPPSAVVVDGFRGRLVVRLRDDWAFNGANYRAGSVVLVDPAALRGKKGDSELLVAPTATEVVEHVHVTPAAIFVGMLDNIRGRLYRYTRGAAGWEKPAIPFPDNGTLRVAVDHDSGAALVVYESFLIPPTAYFVPAGGRGPERLKGQPPTFDGSRFEVRQYRAKSADGTEIPYFVVGPKDLKLDGSNPTWMFSYGGFENALKPTYSGSYEDLHGAYGRLWLERGGVFVLANIRGGGEFGPAWHQAALREHHVRCFEDFEAVARDLSARGITSPAHLGIEGRSNGGLLVAATMLRHPELYGAVVCGNPLLDMKRYHKLLAGASWVAEYGDPDVAEDWAFLAKYSPYQNVKNAVKLPPVLFYTTTRDDRVHPGHARKMAARMETMGYAVDYCENTEGGHHGSVTNEQLATRLAQSFTFLWQHLR
jgi:prolyl oligopeptidase